MGKLYVHCGLHKTATTALQTWLSTHADEFFAAGFLYPRAGRPVEIGGHHNIAWQLTHDRRFDRRVGDLDALFNEIGISRATLFSRARTLKAYLGTGSGGFRSCAERTCGQIGRLPYIPTQPDFLPRVALPGDAGPWLRRRV
jgi:hypothetical protein